MDPDIDRLIEQLGNQGLEQRIEAAQQLASLGIDASPAAPALLAAVECADPTLVDWATACLENCGAPEDDQLRSLIDLLNRDRRDLTAPAAESALQCLEAPAPDTLFWVVTLLGRMEEAGQPACPTLCHWLEECIQRHPAPDAYDPVIKRAIWAIGKIGSDSGTAGATLQRIAQARGDLSADVRRARERLEC